MASFNNFIVSNGELLRCSTEEHIKWCVKSVLSLQKGELLTEPQFGADLMPLMFRRDTDKLRERIVHQVTDAIRRSEPRITLEATEILPDEAEPELLSVKIKYLINESRRHETVRVLL